MLKRRGSGGTQDLSRRPEVWNDPPGKLKCEGCGEGSRRAERPPKLGGFQCQVQQTRRRAKREKWLVCFRAENVLANIDGQGSKKSVKDEAPDII